jgi:hypothetical protein
VVAHTGHVDKSEFELNARLWRIKAEEYRTFAYTVHDSVAVDLMLNVSDSYDKLADWAEKQSMNAHYQPDLPLFP